MRMDPQCPPARRQDLIHRAVRVNAARHPQAPALVGGHGTVSYADLDHRSDELARAFAAAGIGPGTIVPVLLPPSALLPIVLLAVLKAGAAYAALDTAWSGGRMRRISELLSGQVAVVGDNTGDDFAGQRVRVTDDGQANLDVLRHPPRIIAADGEAAMVFFTSGSTGEPKAVLSPHRATSRLFTGCTFARFDHTTVMAQIAAVPWDAFALELWGPLVTGGTCALVTERPLTPGGLREVIVSHGVNTVFLTTSLFHLIVEEDLTAFAGLRTLVVGGEKLSPTHAGRLLAAWPDLRLVNGYGPVESAVFALSHDVTTADLTDEIPLGRPVPRTQVRLMRTDAEFGTPCPPGEVGELCISGDGLAIGYLSDAALTAEKFVTAMVDGQAVRLYRTGDLGRFGPDGVVHYHGRLDRQVKIRGRRIEPAGVERLAAAVPGVTRSVAIPRYDASGNASELWLFYLRSDGSPSEGELAAALTAALPAYSVPDRIVSVDSFPLAATGKVDATALLASFADGAGKHSAEGTDGAVPATGRGRAVAEETTAGIIAAEVRVLLGLSAVDHFASLFSLGGTSLTAVRLCSRLAARFGRAVPVSRLMRDPTITGLATWLDGVEPQPASAAVVAGQPEPSEAPLTPMQQSFVLAHLRSRADVVNHCLVHWTITGPLDVGRLASAVAAVHRAHGYLSSCYVVDGEFMAADSAAPAEFARLEAGDSLAAARLLEQQLRVPFDLTSGPAWRAVLVNDAGSGGWLFGVAVHHVAFDGWSEHVLARELSVAYAAGECGAARSAAAMPTPGETYRVLTELKQAADLAAQRAYWAGTLAGMPSMTWPLAPDPGDHEPRSAQYLLTEDELAGIARQARRRGVTLLTLLLEGVSEAIYACTGQDDFGVGVPVSSRGSETLQRPIGCLIDMVCVRLRRAEPAPAGPAAAVSGALANSDLPFAEVVRALAPPRINRHPLYQVIVAVQDSPAPLLSLVGCRTEIHGQPDLPWPNAELVVELFTAPGRPFRLLVSRDPAALDAKTFTGIADGVADWLSTRTATRRT